MKNRIEFRQASINELSALVSLLNELFTIEKEFTPDMKKQKKALQVLLSHNEIATIYIALINNCVIGMVSFLYTISTYFGERVATLEDMIITKEYRNRGIGSNLLKYAINKEEKKIKRITLLTDDTNYIAQKFYKNFNFKKSEMIVYRKFNH